MTTKIERRIAKKREKSAQGDFGRAHDQIAREQAKNRKKVQEHRKESRNQIGKAKKSSKKWARNKVGQEGG